MTRLRSWIQRLLPRHMASQIILLAVAALIGSHLLSLYLVSGERRAALLLEQRGQAVSRIAAVVRLGEETPADLDERVLRAASRPGAAFDIHERAPVVGGEPDTLLGGLLARRLRVELAQDRDVVVRGWRDPSCDNQTPSRWDDWHRRAAGSMRDMRNVDPRMMHEGRGHDMSPPPCGRIGLQAAVGLEDGRWLVFTANQLGPPPASPWPVFASVVAAVVVLGGLLWWLTRRMTRPLAALAAAADRMGRGDFTVSVPEAGPEDLRHTVRAFNAMNARIRRFVDDRAKLLAALSHDLRTPITSLRLRAEFVEPPELKAKLLATVDDMAAMTEATLAFARESSAGEALRDVDVAGLAEALCDDLADLGWAVGCQIPGPVVLRCRPVALKRALRNLVENAVRYGHRAEVSVRADAAQVVVAVTDDGPGVAEADRARIFEPFTRLEGSRSKDTGGAGLGLAIARSAVRAHGGDIVVTDGPDGGAVFEIQLPRGG